MSCEFTEKVSLLIDGELSLAEMHEVERHLLTCVECQEVRADFINLRQQIAAYPVFADVRAGRRALAEILGTEKPAQSPRLGARLRAAFATPRFTPAWAAAVALILVACAVAFFVYHNAQRSTSVANANNGTPERAPVVPAPQSPNNNTRNEVASTPSNGPTVTSTPQRATSSERGTQSATASGGTLRRARRSNGAQIFEASNQLPRERRAAPPPQVITPERESAPEIVNAAFAHAPADTETLTARHVEQAALLLRSFRNARTDEQDAASDLAYERRRAQQLLYANIVLRREAATAGNVQVATLLDSLEPILLDIANLPERPQAEDVRAIRERVERKNLVALLQVNSDALARAYE